MHTFGLKSGGSCAGGSGYGFLPLSNDGCSGVDPRPFSPSVVSGDGPRPFTPTRLRQ